LPKVNAKARILAAFQKKITNIHIDCGKPKKNCWEKNLMSKKQRRLLPQWKAAFFVFKKVQGA
jgi:hypothetical protein